MTVICFDLERENYKVLTFQMNFKYISNFQFQNSYEISNVINTMAPTP